MRKSTKKRKRPAACIDAKDEGGDEQPPKQKIKKEDLKIKKEEPNEAAPPKPKKKYDYGDKYAQIKRDYGQLKTALAKKQQAS